MIEVQQISCDYCPDLTIVTSLYYSSKYLQNFYKKICNLFDNSGTSFELIFVDDGSPDNSAEIARQIADEDERVTLISLSRNFGQHPALLTGVLAASGKYVSIIDCDLEENPEDLFKMYNLLISYKGSIDVVYGLQEVRNGPFSKRIGGKLFYTLFRYLGNVNINSDMMVMRVMSRRYVETLRKFNLNNPILAGLFALTGFSQISYICKKYYKGSTTYNTIKRITKAVRFLVNFSTRPAYIALLAGLIVTATTTILALWIILRRMIFGTSVEGWTSLAIINFFGIGFSFLMNGVILLYIAEIFTNTSGRPMSIIREVYKKNSKSSKADSYLS